MMLSGLKTNAPKMVLGAAIATTYALLILGNLVTTTGSGLDCPDWPLCHGTVIPPPEIGIWIEWSHRLLGGVTGVLIIFSAIYILVRTTGVIRLFMKILLGAIVVVVLLGGWIVLSEAPYLDSIRRIAIVSSHILTAAMIWTLLVLAYRPISKGVHETLEDNYPLWLFGMVIVQIFLGVFVRYSNSSLACPDWPLCQGAILPPSFMPEVLIHYTHRLVGYIIFGFTLWRLVKALQSGDKNLKTHAITFTLVILQVTFGVLIVWMKMFLPVLVLHGATAFGILGWTAYQASPGLVSAKDIAKA